MLFIVIFTGIKRYVCHVCGKAFVLNESLSTHLKVHESRPSFSCDICGAKFKYENGVRLHKKIHSNVKEFKCSICSREFLRKRTLEDHLKVHKKGTDRKSLFTAPVEFCTLCSKGFASSYGLKRHMRKHQMGKLKNFNKSCGKPGSPNSNMAAVTKQHCRNSSIHPKTVLVDERIVDDGQLFEKVDPACFMAVDARLSVESENLIEQSELEKLNNDFVINEKSQNDDMQCCFQIPANTFSKDFSVSNGQSDVSEDRKKSDIPVLEKVSTFKYKTDIEHYGYSSIQEVINVEHLSEVRNCVTEMEQENIIKGDKEILSDDQSQGEDTMEYFAIEEVEENTKKLSEGSDIVEDLGPTDRDNSANINHAKNNDANQPLKFIVKDLGIASADLSEIRNTQLTGTAEKSIVVHVKVTDSFDDDSSLKDDGEDFFCSFCEQIKKFKYKQNLISHLKKFHKGELAEKQQCFKCSRTFLMKADFEKHCKKFRDDPFHGTAAMNLECMFCLTKYTSKASLKVHLHRYHRDRDTKTYRCNQCERMFASRVLYKNHVDSHNLGGLKSREKCRCEICRCQFLTRCSLRRHMRVVHRIEEDEEIGMKGGTFPEKNTEFRSTEGKALSEEGNCEMEDEIGNILQKKRSYYNELQKGNIESNKAANLEASNPRQYIELKDEADEFACGNDEFSVIENVSEKLIAAKNCNEPLEITTESSKNKTGEIDLQSKSNNSCSTSCNEVYANNYTAEVSNDGIKSSDCSLTRKSKLNEGYIASNPSKSRFQRKFRCTTCRKSFHMMSTLKQHLSGHIKQKLDVTRCFPCEHCHKTFSKLSHLMIHTHKSHSKFVLDCSYCPRKFATVSSLKTHMLMKHRKNKQAYPTTLEKLEINSGKGHKLNPGQQYSMCSFCGKQISKKCLKGHMCTDIVEVHNKGSTCLVNLKHQKNGKKQIAELRENTDANEYSGMKFSSKGNTKVHAISNADTNILICPVCSVKFCSKGNLNRHCRLKHKDCHVNSRESDTGSQPTVNSRESRIASHTNVNMIHEKCGEEFKEKQKCLQYTDKNACEKRYQCGICKQVWKTEALLKTHLKEDHRLQSFACDKCSKTFSSYSNLSRHKSISHTYSNKVFRNFMCNMCGKCFTANDSLRVHMFIHTGERPYRCSMCDATYVQSGHLNRHIKVVHEGKLNYQCQHIGCDKSFYDLSSLKVHERSHTNERPYSCPKCPQKFRTSNAKKAHMRTHSLTKQFECHICFQGLTTKHCLQNHLKRHEMAEKMNPSSLMYDPHYKATIRQKVVKKMEEKRFGCSFCFRKFTTTRGVYAHQRKYCESKKDNNCGNVARYYVIQES